MKIKRLKTCHDCGCKEGELHQEYCEMERCPYCKGQQLLSCDKHDWKNIKQKDREPYFKMGFSCKRCGEFFPDMLMVSDEEWKLVCGMTYNLDSVLCPKCMKFIIKEVCGKTYKEVSNEKKQM